MQKMVKVFAAGIFFLTTYLVINSLLYKFVPDFFSFLNIFIGIFAFVFSYALSLKFNEEYLQLIELKNDLENAVQKRTQELQKSKEEIEELSAQKTKFFINLAHEIKTPLTLIQNYMERIMRKFGDSRDLIIIKQNIDKLCHDMVNFLDSEKLTRGQLFFNHHQITDFSELLKMKCLLFQDTASKKRITITTDIGKNIYVKADPSAIDRIMDNLIENAIRYNREAGEIQVGLKKAKQQILLTVSDTGIGITTDQQKNIFKPYHQISHNKRNIQGMGMGLNIVNQIVQSLHGKITIESEFNQGSKFIVALNSYDPKDHEEINKVKPSTPIDTGPGQPALQPVPFQKERETILIVEDNPDMLGLMQDELSHEYNTLLAENGKAALSKLKSHSKPDLIISDIMMDEMDGYEFFETLMRDEQFTLIPFMFLTARSSQTEKIKKIKEGAIDFIQKPFSMEELKAKINAILSQKRKLQAAGMKEAIQVITDRIASGDNQKSEKREWFEKKCTQYGITKREREIILLASQGLEHKEIATELNISIKTVIRHIQNIYEKVGINNKIELVNTFFNLNTAP